MSILPEINRQFVCIVPRNKPVLAATIASWLSVPGYYLPIFEFPFVTTGDRPEDAEKLDEHSMSVARARDFAGRLRNILTRMKGCQNVISAGLSDDQKSYLQFLGQFNVIEIEDEVAINFRLSPFFANNRHVLRCRSSELLTGLSIALKNGMVLHVDEGAVELPSLEPTNYGLILIENEGVTQSVVAAMYSCSIQAEMAIVPPLETDDVLAVQGLIQEWQKGSSTAYNEIETIVMQRVGNIEMDKYPFATFFTQGLPYSLILENRIPMTYVNLHWSPDFLIMNSLLTQGKENTGAVVFSPQVFTDEETAYVHHELESHHYFVKEVIGDRATVHNFDLHVREFPYDILHVCSHGGEVKGTAIRLRFTDRDGQEHIVEYDFILGLVPELGQELIQIQPKVFPRKFNGLLWKSPELKARNYPHYVFADMYTAIQTPKHPGEEIIEKGKLVYNSCSIQCADFIHQGLFNRLASGSSPVIFNNTCSSWYGIAENFMDSGARAYIGTLWNVNNTAAIAFATEYYKRLFSGTILEAFFRSQSVLNSNGMEHIYIYWGLHFTTLMPSADVDHSRAEVFKNLIRAKYRWTNRLKEIKSPMLFNQIRAILRWIDTELKASFTRNDYVLFYQEILKNKQQKG